MIRTGAGIFTCLFSLALFSPLDAPAQQWAFDERTQYAYDLALNLQTEEARQLVSPPATPQELYVAAFSEALELLISEDREKFSEFEDHFRSRLDMVTSSTPDYQFVQAEIHLQWAFIYLKFGQEIDAASHLRQAYLIAEDCREKSGDYMAIKKTSGLLQIIVGSVPEKYDWVLSLLGMKGSMARGMDDLEALSSSDSPLNFEAGLLLCLVQGFIFQKPDTGFVKLKKILMHRSGNRLGLYLASALAIKDAQSEEALTLLNKLSENNAGIPLYYTFYLKGEVLLHKADYAGAIAAYQWFISHYKGRNYVKDAYYKMGLCYWLNGNTTDALSLFKEARAKGAESTEADKSAAASLSEKRLPHVMLSKVRYAFDGGYYDRARDLLNSMKDADLPAKRDQVEYYYRKARLEHKTGHFKEAQLFYSQVIDMAGDESWYFAPNACLQMGYIFEKENQLSKAVFFFKKALAYKRHAYKNSIDAEAKSALARLQQ